jgi:hypothetical protein
MAITFEEFQFEIGAHQLRDTAARPAPALKPLTAGRGPNLIRKKCLAVMAWT